MTSLHNTKTKQNIPTRKQNKCQTVVNCPVWGPKKISQKIYIVNKHAFRTKKTNKTHKKKSKLVRILKAKTEEIKRKKIKIQNFKWPQFKQTRGFISLLLTLMIMIIIIVVVMIII